MLDYAANAVMGWSVAELRARYFSTPEAVDRFNAFLEGGDADQFWSNVGVNLAGGRIRMIFVADIIPPELRRVVDFLAAQLAAAPPSGRTSSNPRPCCTAIRECMDGSDHHEEPGVGRS